MSFINWGHETPEQKEIRRRMEERMMFEQMSYSAAMAAAAAAGVGSGARKKNYTVTGRSSMASYIDENGNFVFRTYNYDSDTLNVVHSTGLSDSDYDDRIYVLQDKGFLMRYSGPDGVVYYFTDINGEVIKKLTINDSQYNNYGVDYDSGVSITVYAQSDNTLTLNIFDGASVKKYTIDNMYTDMFGNMDYYTRQLKGGTNAITWLTQDQSEYKLALLLNGEVVIVDSITAGESSWTIESDWDSEFITILKANYTTGIYQSFKVIGPDGSVEVTSDISAYGHTNLRDAEFYGKGKFFFALSGNANQDLDIWAYNYESNTIIHETVTDGSLLSYTSLFHYQDGYYPNGMSNYNDDGVFSINISNDLLILLYNDLDYYNDGYRTEWYKVDECQIYTLFDGDTQFYSYDAAQPGMTGIKLDDNESILRSFSEDQTIVLDGFTWNDSAPGGDQSNETFKRLSIKARADVDNISPKYLLTSTLFKIGEGKIHDKFFLGSRLVYAYYSEVDNQLQWIAFDSNGQSNPTSFVLTVADDTEYYRTHDTLVIIDNGGELTYVSNSQNGNTFTNFNTLTGVWYNKVFISDKNGNGDSSPTTEYSFYPNNTGWGSIVLVHDTGVDEEDYSKALSVTQEAWYEFDLPMIYGNPWYGELGRDTLLFAWVDGEGGWTASLFDLRGNTLSSSKIAVDANDAGPVDLWNLTDRAIAVIDPNTSIGDTYFYYFNTDGVNIINAGSNDYWWENDFPAWYTID